MKKTKKRDWVDLEEKYNVMEAVGYRDDGEDANGVWISWYLKDLEEYIDMCIHQALKANNKKWRKRIKKAIKDKRIPYQALAFGDCPKCGQETNQKWVDMKCKEIRTQALSDLLKGDK
jgi:hypothetical protein